MLEQIHKKMRQLQTSGQKMVKKQKLCGEGDDLKATMLECHERLMNLDYVMSDDEIRSDIETIYKV